MANPYISNSSNGLAADARSLNNLKFQAGGNTKAAIQEAAKQFESLFMRELIKSMRDATVKSGLLDSPGGDLGADMLDQQLSVHMSGRAGGLSDLIARQLMQRVDPGEASKMPFAALPANAASEPAVSAPRPSGSQVEFVQRHGEAAARVEESSGLPSGYMLGQAGHETGWGRSEIMHKDGTPSFNLFGIKATGGWSGKVAEITTTEYTDGVAQKVVAKFRAYSSYEESFRDYARLITQSPRYAQAKEQTSSAMAYASGLQRAGYATDPDYASKLSRAINTTLQLQRSQI